MTTIDKRKLIVKFLSLSNQKRIINKMSVYDDSKSVHDNCVSFIKEIERQDRLEELAKQMEE